MRVPSEEHKNTEPQEAPYPTESKRHDHDLEIPAFLDRRIPKPAAVPQADCVERRKCIESIKAAWCKSVEGIFEAGEALLKLKDYLPHGEFESTVKCELPFTPSVARKLMAIAESPRLTNRATWHVLPASWTILYELTKLDDTTFKGMLAEGSIDPSMTKLVAENARWLEKHRKFARLKRLPKKALSAPAKDKASPRPRQLDPETAQSLLRFVESLVEIMRQTPPNVPTAVRLYMLPDDRRALAELATEAIAWLSAVYDEAQPETRSQF